MPVPLKSVLIFLVVLTFFVFSASASYAQPIDWSGNCVDANGTATIQGFECIFRNLLTIIIPLGGLVAFVIVLIGGFQYLTSGGDPKQAQKASSTITSALIGIVVVLIVWFLFNLLNAFTGLDLLRFAIPGP